MSLRNLVASMAESGEGERISIGDLVVSMGPRAFVPLLLVPSLIAFSPLSGILGVASICGLMIAALSLQLMVRRTRIWLPQFMLSRSIERQRVHWICQRLDKPLKWIDGHSRPRIMWLMRHPFGHLPGSLCLAVGCAMPLMELVPLSATLGGASVTLMVVGLLLDDGLYVALGIGFVLSIATVIVGALA